MEIKRGRWTAQLDGDFVVFLIGAQVRDPQDGRAVGLLMEMAAMLEELAQDPSKGLLAFERYGDFGGVIVQYRRSFDALEAYAKNPSAKHAPVWRAWNRLTDSDTKGAGIWHETFQVSPGRYEAIYQNMPVMGLQKAGVPVTVSDARATARARMAV